MEPKKLGFGLMRLPLLNADDPASIDIELLKEMVDVFMERGFTYFDTAWNYCKFTSECAIKEALVDRYPRESFTLTTKLHVAFVESKEERDRNFAEQKRKTGVEYFDYYLMHALSRKNYAKYKELEMFEWLSELKAKGEVKHIGFSFHDDAEFLDELLNEHPEVEFVQLQINYLDWESEDVQSRKCYETAVRHGKKVLIMEPVKGGALANVSSMVKDVFNSYDDQASPASWAIRYAASLEHVFMVLSGMSNMEQVLDNTSYMMHFQPLSEAEYGCIDEALKIMQNDEYIQCTSCRYCVDGCPQNIQIPSLISIYNNDLRDPNQHEIQKNDYENHAMQNAKASACIGCGQCESVCPQKLPIIEILQKITNKFE